MSVSFYGRQTPRQMQGKFTRPAAGLNSYTPSFEINDNLLSDCLDCLPYKETGIYVHSNSPTTLPMVESGVTNLGQAHISITDKTQSGYEYIVTLAEDGTHAYIVVTDVALGTQAVYDADATGIMAVLVGFDSYSVCRYATEAANYVVFSCNVLQKLIYFDYTTVATVDLPFYPTKIVSYANRIFALDDKNTLWWSRAGAPFNIAPMTDSWYSAITTSTVLEDAGYWIQERERSLTDMCVLNEAIYLFGRQNIYIFQGTNYDTFQMSLLVSDFGVEGGFGISHVTVANNIAYIVDDEKVYEFNGSDKPRLISHPIFVNTGLTNGTLGGIPKTDMSHIVADRNYVYFYHKWHCPIYEDVVYFEYIYVFDIKTRTWWKVSAFNDATSALSENFHVQIIPKHDMSDVYSIVSDWNGTRHWFIYTIIGTQNTDNPYIITKCFNDMPSEVGTLTQLVLQLKGTLNESSDITIYYSLSMDADDFIDFYTENEHIYTGDLENIFIPMPVSAIANAHHYRIKVEFGGDSCVVYNIERRFRVRGLSR